MQRDKVDIEQVLAQGGTVQIHPIGDSMNPLLVSGRDWAIIEPVPTDGCRRGDVVLYRRNGSVLVLHRIWKLAGDKVYMVGDGQTEIEGPLSVSQIKGIMTAYVKKGKQVEVTRPGYRFYTRIWMAIRPLRSVILRWERKIQRFHQKYINLK